MLIVVSYDISDDKRRYRVFKKLKDYGKWMQYSVFECNISREANLRLQDALEEMIDKKEDNINYYYLCETCRDKIHRIGRKKPRDDGDILII